METQATILDWFVPTMAIITVLTILVTMYLSKTLVTKLHINDKTKYHMFVRWLIVAEVLIMIAAWVFELIRLSQ